ncbi:MAG: hypothetical protein Tsb0017_12190 [Geothermobacteraceae bacterium]
MAWSGARRIIGIALLALLCWPSGAEAKQKAILLLSGLRQFIEIDADYQGQQSDYDFGRDRQSHQIDSEQAYQMDVAYSLLDPDLLRGQIELRLGAMQEYFTGTAAIDGDDEGGSQGFSLAYDLYGAAFQNRSWPASFSARRETRDILRRFASNYRQQDRQESVRLTLGNRFLPASLGFSTFTSKTDGLDADRSSRSRSLSASVSHSLGGRFVTNVASSFGQSESRTEGGDPFDSDLFSFNADNQFWFGSGRLAMRLDSGWSRDTQTGTRPSERSRWREELEWRPGRALLGQLGYELLLDRVPEQRERREEYRASLRHTLFRSLTTQLLGRGEKREVDLGVQRERLASVSLDYRKQLPRDTHLGLTLRQTGQITDQDFLTDLAPVIDERLTLAAFGRNYLANINVEPASVEVFNAARLIRYIEGVDYLLQADGRQLDLVLLPGGALADGDTVSVDYSYRVNSAIRYLTWTSGLSGSWYRGRKRDSLHLTGGISLSDQRLLDGAADRVGLGDSLSATLGARLERGEHTFGLNAGYFDTSADSYSSVELSWAWERRRRSVSYTLRARDLYRLRDAGNENLLIVGAELQRRFGPRTRLRLYGDAAVESALSRDRQSAGAGAELEAGFGRSLLLLTVSSEWEFQETGWNREDRLFLTLRRYL